MSRSLAINCYALKQPFAIRLKDSGWMEKKGLNQVLAENLKARMAKANPELKQASLAAKAGIGQTTVGLYLNPRRRKDSASGKEKSATLSAVQKLAEALGCHPLALLTDADALPIPFELLDELFAVEDGARQRIIDMLRGALAAAPKRAEETTRAAA